jgi:translation initiation factor 2 beta subunit (eIF-2beta)/eIF-5
MKSFNNMLDNMYNRLSILNNFEKVKLKKPTLSYINKMKCWVDVMTYLTDIKRDKEHFMNYLKKESENSVLWRTADKKEILFKKSINLVRLKQYMVNYIKYCVLCRQCNNMNTNIIKDKEIKRYRLKCNNCCNENYI